jgi:hypothetical protein
MQWQKKTEKALLEWSVKAKSEFDVIFQSLAGKDKISDDDFVLALSICESMVRPSKWNFSSHAHFDVKRYEQWCKGENLPDPQTRKAILEICYITASSRNLSDVEKMVYALGYDFDISESALRHETEIIESTPVRSVQDNLLAFDLWMKVSELSWTARVEHGLAQLKIVYVGQLVQKKETEVSVMHYIGPKSREEIKTVLSGIGAQLNMAHPDLDEFNQDLANGDESKYHARVKKLLE